MQPGLPRSLLREQKASCLLNPRAGHETTLKLLPTRHTKKIAVVGAGPAGLSAAVTAAQRGHKVVLFEANAEIGGQFDMARRIPGKEEFNETIRYYTTMLKKYGVTVLLNKKVDAQELIAGKFDNVILATGVKPRVPAIPGIDHPMVLSYPEVIKQAKPVGKRVAVVGAGGIGFDVSEFLTIDESPTLNLKEWRAEWGVSEEHDARGSLTKPIPAPAIREVYLCQRKKGLLGKGLGKTTGGCTVPPSRPRRSPSWPGSTTRRSTMPGYTSVSAKSVRIPVCSRSIMW